MKTYSMDRYGLYLDGEFVSENIGHKGMTVFQLIQILLGMPPDAIVMTNQEGMAYKVREIRDAPKDKSVWIDA
jgi:hypothetical protein